MEPWIPLIQTGLWVGLIVWVLLRFNSDLKIIVQALRERIQAGGSLKAGPIEFGELIRPLSNAEQSKRLQAEENAAAALPLPEGQKDVPCSSYWQGSFRNRYIIAEDLVLRKLQDEYGTLISRQVSGGDRMGFDGFFTKDNRPYAIEVKYLTDRMEQQELVKHAEQIHLSIIRLGWKKFTLILAVVTDDEHPPCQSQLDSLSSALSDLNYPVNLRVYPFKALADEFGIAL